MDKLREFAKRAFKASASVLALTLAVMIATDVVEALYDLRGILYVVVGALAYEPVYKILNKIKGLEDGGHKHRGRSRRAR